MTTPEDTAVAVVLAGSDNLNAQAVILAGAQQPLIGEEMFAAGAYLEPGPLQTASLTLQDVLRWLIIAAILGGSVLMLVGWL